MKYHHIVPGIFLERPNRFIAYVELEGRREKVHVKNTGRCKELLIPGAKVYLEKSGNPNRSTAYDLVAVEKGKLLVNMDSQAPNKAVEEWILEENPFPGLICVRPETTYGNSRFDFYVETQTEKLFIEVKGVTLENEGVTRFPDAPSERAVKHVEELIAAKKEGYRVCVIFVVQMEGMRYFTPNRDTHAAFADALIRAKEQGVEIGCLECRVTPESLKIKGKLPVFLRESLLLEVPKPLLKWYDKNKRILPWREESTPYRVWVSEIMLQQTRVEAVKPYFQRFMEQLPDIKSLAEAQEEPLLKLWEGLGYYNRVRNLQKAAIQIMEEYGGQMPKEYEELLKLKGIGSYTAGAIASIAYGVVRPAVDGNVLRVLSRIRRDERPISEAKVKTAVEEELLEIMPRERPGDFNQAMMEIGACVCVPNGAPHCMVCPLSGFCETARSGCWQEYPKKAAAKARQTEDKTVLIIRDEERAVIRKRPAKGLLAGMYEFPSLEGFYTAEEVVKYLADNGLKTIHIKSLEEARHVFSHKEWHMKGFMVRVDELDTGRPGEAFSDWLYVEPGETEDKYPIPAAFAAYTRYLSIRLGNERFL